MRESRRGSMRSEMATDSEVSELPATAASMRRRSGLFSAQKSASASSLSKIGTSSHLAIARIASARKSHHTSASRITFHASRFTSPASGPFCAGRRTVRSALLPIWQLHASLRLESHITHQHHASRFTHHVSLRQHLVHFALVEEPLDRHFFPFGNCTHRFG